MRSFLLRRGEGEAGSGRPGQVIRDGEAFTETLINALPRQGESEKTTEFSTC